LPTSFPSAERNVEFVLSYDDSWTNWPMVFHPYVKFWDHTSGPPMWSSATGAAPSTWNSARCQLLI
jgi:hypothetical protein